MSSRRKVEQGRLPFEYEVVPDQGKVTAYGGLPIVVETMRALGLPDSIRRHLQVGHRQREHDEQDMVEGFVLLMAAGGECLDDFEMLRQDRALGELVGRSFPSPETARRFLYEFHDDKLLETARAALPEGEVAYIPKENEALQGLLRINGDLIKAVAARGKSKRATVDVDATIIESHKKQAQAHYEGGRGYQPQVAVWAEADLVLCDEFRDGNVPAGKEPLGIVKKALSMLPSTITDRRLRGDSALYEQAVLRYLVEQGVEFTISADMTKELRRVCQQVPPQQWTEMESRPCEQVYVSEVEFTPGDWPKDAKPLRYLALRFVPTQGHLFEQGAEPKYLAVVTNRPGEVQTLVRWHWEKAGTIEQVHDVVKNELGGGVLPCGRFGANAAWFRLALLTYNVLSAFKSIGMPEMATARPKRLRFRVFTLPAMVLRHARQLVARVLDRMNQAAALLTSRQRLWATVPL